MIVVSSSPLAAFPHIARKLRSATRQTVMAAVGRLDCLLIKKTL